MARIESLRQQGMKERLCLIPKRQVTSQKRDGQVHSGNRDDNPETIEVRKHQGSHGRNRVGHDGSQEMLVWTL